MGYNKITTITLVFENCEVITFDRHDFIKFDTSQIREEIHALRKYKFVDEVVFVLHADSDKYYEWYDEKSKETAYERICGGDITHIEIKYDDADLDYINVNWTDADPSGMSNANQFVRYDKQGNLYVVIAEGNLFYSDRFSEVEWRDEDV